MNQLKDAEKSATKLVQDERRRRIDRMKEAKAEADTAVTSYRNEMEQLYQQQLSKQNGNNKTISTSLDASTSNDIAKMSRDYSSRKEAVTNSLIDLVLKVNLTAPVARS